MEDREVYKMQEEKMEDIKLTQEQAISEQAISEPTTIEKPPKEKTISKEQFDKVSREYAQLKKQYNEKLTEDEKQQLLIAEKDEKLKNYERKDTMNNIALSLTENGITSSQEIAELFVNGDYKTAIEKMTSVYKDKLTTVESELKVKGLKDLKSPTANEQIEIPKTIDDLMREANNK